MKSKVQYIALGIIFYSISHQKVFSQNLVQNYSFEEYRKCPLTYTPYKKMFKRKRELIPYWYMPTKGTSDYFNKCSSKMGVPSNFAGKQHSHTGNGYAGIVCILLQGNQLTNDIRDFTYREYIQTILLEPMKKGNLYCVKFYAALSACSEYAINSIGAYFSVERIIDKKSMANLPVVPQVSFPDSLFIDSKEHWTLIGGVFKPQENVQYLTIGNFKNNENTKYKISDIGKIRKDKILKMQSYYYIDDVSVELINDSSECDCSAAKKIIIDSLPVTPVIPLAVDKISENTFKNIERDKPVILQNIFFETDKAVLLPQSLTELNMLVKYLQESPAFFIQINGHTDNIASDKHNLVLSEARALAVMDYLIENGIDRNRLTSKGFGSSSPVADNNTEEGRAQNRRVEFVIIKK